MFYEDVCSLCGTQLNSSGGNLDNQSSHLRVNKEPKVTLILFTIFWGTFLIGLSFAFKGNIWLRIWGSSLLVIFVVYGIHTARSKWTTLFDNPVTGTRAMVYGISLIAVSAIGLLILRIL